ncbi:MAG: phenylalanine--tRNA ligase subunit alpha [Clostridia bacterium]
MQERLKGILERALREINACSELSALENCRVKYLGKKGELTVFLRGMGNLSPEERPVIGRLVNEAKEEIETLLLCQKERVLKLERERSLKEEEIDITIPGKRFARGKRHPLTKTLDEIKSIFLGLGFTVVEGPEVELAYYNFTALNIPENHPARDVQDTFYITEDIVLRTHTSPDEPRVMEKTKPPIRVLIPGRVYRADDVDATHSPVFHQIEGLVVDEGITLGDLKGTFDLFVKKLYGEHMETKFRPSHFPFTEPSAEIDATCFVCEGKGCRVCKDTGWIELSGAGMSHPKVLERCGIDTTRYSGFAFGMGLDRLTMLKYGIDDMRLLFENDVRFLEQF